MDNSIGEERPAQKHFRHLGMLQGTRIMKNENIVSGIRDAYNGHMCIVDRSTSTCSIVVKT